jgi:hypothetical protein
MNSERRLMKIEETTTVAGMSRQAVARRGKSRAPPFPSLCGLPVTSVKRNSPDLTVTFPWLMDHEKRSLYNQLEKIIPNLLPIS